VRGRELVGLGEADRAWFVLEQALGLWRGRALPELEDWEPGRVAAERLETLRMDAEELMLDAAVRAGRCREVLAEAQARVAERPLREHRWALLAAAQYQAGRQADALLTLRQARAVVAEELGLDPGPELVELEQAILRQDLRLAAVPGPQPSATCPYRGLVAYDVADAEAYFGRGEEVSQCRRRLAGSAVLVVVGPSGCGKSSLVRAGVAAALKRDGRRVVVVTPGARPMDALTGLPATGRPPVLVMDQCEEAVTLCPDPAERAQFFQTLAAYRGPLVVALRADRLGELSAHPSFARVVERGMYLLKRMDDANLRAAIEGPARDAGLVFEPGLVDLLVRDVEGEPGALPLLSHTLRETWRHREGRTLTVAGYRSCGGIRGAVAQSAEQVYNSAPQELRATLRDLLLRLVAPSPDGEPQRGKVPRVVVAGDPRRERAIEMLVAARLVTSDHDEVQLAHEALARAWPRLRGWLDDDLEGQRILRHLATTAQAWESMGRPDSELYRGVRLARALQWRQQSGSELNPAEREFLDVSRRLADRERSATRRRRRKVVSALAAGLVATTLLASAAVINQRQAVRAAELARARELTTAASAALDTDPSLAKLLAVAAADLAAASPELTSLLHRAFAAERVVARYTWPGDQPVEVLSTDLHPTGRWLVASGEASTHLEVYDFHTAQVVWSWDVVGAGIEIEHPVFTAGGQQVVAGLFRSEAALAGDPAPAAAVGAYFWDAPTGQVSQRIDLGPCGGPVRGVSAGHVLVMTTNEPDCFGIPNPATWTGVVELVDRATGQRQVLTSSAEPYTEAAMSGDGRFAAFTERTSTGSRSVVLDVGTAERVLQIDPRRDHPGVGPGYAHRLNHDGSLLLAGNRPIAVWDVARGEIVATFEGHRGMAVPYQFGADGTSVLSAGADGVVFEWEMLTGEPVARYPAAGSGRVSQSDDGLVLVADPGRRGATLIASGIHGEMWSVPTCAGFTLADTLHISGGYAAVSALCRDGGRLQLPATYVIDLDARTVAYTLAGHSGQPLTLSPDGTLLARQEAVTGPDDLNEPQQRHDRWHGPIRVRDLATGKLVAEAADTCAWPVPTPVDVLNRFGCRSHPDTPFPVWSHHMAWSFDSTLFAVTSYGPEIGPAAGVWRAATGELVSTLEEGCIPWSTTFTPNSRHLLLFCVGDDEAVLVSTETWRTERTAELDTSVEGLTRLLPIGYTADGSALVVVGGWLGDGGGWLHWIDPRTLEIVHTLARVHDGQPKSAAMSPNGTLAATGSSDGFIKVWDVMQRRLVQELYLGHTEVQGLAFLDNEHLAVAPQEGGVHVFTLDPDELIEIVRASLTRELTPAECHRYNFGADCPTLTRR
jgi:WD40 repeat protein/energy-coupling factor transporter ATP-binding protein EcfA2